MPDPVRYFLIKNPQPAKVRATLPDGKERVITINVGSRSKWADAQAALVGAVRAEALNREGDVIRSVDFELDDAEQATETAPFPALPAGSSELERCMTHVAKLLVDSADRAAARHEAAYRMGFEQQSQVLKVYVDRLGKLEMAWQKLLMKIDPKAEESSGLPNADVLVAALLSRVAPPNGGGRPAVDTTGEDSDGGA